MVRSRLSTVLRQMIRRSRISERCFVRIVFFIFVIFNIFILYFAYSPYSAYVIHYQIKTGQTSMQSAEWTCPQHPWSVDLDIEPELGLSIQRAWSQQYSAYFTWIFSLSAWVLYPGRVVENIFSIFKLFIIISFMKIRGSILCIFVLSYSTYLSY